MSPGGLTDVRMMDNICTTKSGQVLIQEDVGNNPRLGRMWLYTPWNDSIRDIGISDSTRYLLGGSNFVTQDEETSGIISAEQFMGSGWFFLNMKGHYGIPGELTEGGQLMAAFIPATQVGVACCANRDGSTFAPVVNVNDLQCFLNKCAAGNLYANCDGSTGSPALAANDFQCFLTRFAGGCAD